ncbi:hypothetical protein ACLB2K_043580 [Fragaria x ananassa]
MAETTSSSESKRIAVVTGANKGIGFEISRQLATNGVGVVNNAGVLGSTYLTDNVVVEPEISSKDSERLFSTGTAEGTKPKPEFFTNIIEFVGNEKAKKELGDVDNLTVEKVDKLAEEFLEDVKLDLIESKGWPVNMSSYIVSKAALNAYTRILAKKYPKIATNAVSPGFTKTDINQNTGTNTIEEAAEGPVKLALIADTGISGLYFELTEESTFE